MRFVALVSIGKVRASVTTEEERVRVRANALHDGVLAQMVPSDCATHHFGRRVLPNRREACNDAKVFIHSTTRLYVKYLQKIGALGYVLIALLFFACGFALIVLGAIEIWSALLPSDEQSVQERFRLILECVGLLTIAVAALELGQTVLEEEVQRAVHVSSPTRLRRFLSRFLIVVVVSLGVECLVGVFQFMHTKPELLPHVASIGVAAAILLASWGVFVKMNVEAEKLEPEAMRDAKREDKDVET